MTIFPFLTFRESVLSHVLMMKVVKFPKLVKFQNVWYFNDFLFSRGKVVM